MNFNEIKEKFYSKAPFEKVRRRTRKNEAIADYYEQYADTFDLYYGKKAARTTTEADTLKRKAENIRACTVLWTTDYYRLQGIKDLQGVNLCHDRFCDNCQQWIATQRTRKYTPIFDRLYEGHRMYHAVFTVPNVTPDCLKETLDRMFREFGYMVRIFKGDAKIKGYSFEQYGFRGAVRALEITRNKETGEYHPHFHCIFAFGKDGVSLYRKKDKLNKFSFDREFREGERERFFSDFEVLIQKIWYLRFNGIKVTAENIDALALGYSCIFEIMMKGNYKEVFKYATKGLIKTDDDNLTTNYFNFLCLYHALAGRRVIQTYGVLRCLKFEETVDLSADGDNEYFQLLAELQKIEQATRFVCEPITSLEKDAKERGITFISRSKIAEGLKNE